MALRTTYIKNFKLKIIKVVSMQLLVLQWKPELGLTKPQTAPRVGHDWSRNNNDSWQPTSAMLQWPLIVPWRLCSKRPSKLDHSSIQNSEYSKGEI